MSSGGSMKFCLFVELDLVPSPGDVADILEGVAHQIRQLQLQRPQWTDMRDLTEFKKDKDSPHAALHGVLEHMGKKTAWFSVAEVETHGAPSLEDALDSDVSFHAHGLYGKQREGLGPLEQLLEDADERPN